MPCYTPEPTQRELHDWHETKAKSILLDIDKHRYAGLSGPAAVRILCEWCNNHYNAEIEKVGAKYWYQDHIKYDLRQSGLAKLTKEEKDALGLGDKR